MLNNSVAIIGAGVSAAVCAKALTGLVEKVSVFEQSSYVGGRLTLNGSLSTTPSFTVSTPFFQQIVDGWLLDGLVNENQTWNVEIANAETHSLSQTQTEYTVLPNMVSLVEKLLENVSVRLNSEVVELERRNKQWRLFDFEGGYLGQFDCVVFSSSVASLYDLVKPSPFLLEQFQKIAYSPVWNVVLTLKGEINTPYDHAIFIDSAVSSSFYSGSNQVVITATPEWSEKYSAWSHQQVEEHLTAIYCQQTQTEVTSIESASAKFWLNKTPINTLNEDCIFDADLGLGACGDWCTSPRVEGAVLSGFSMADRVMKHLSQGLSD